VAVRAGLDDRDAVAASRQTASSSQACESAADDHHIGVALIHLSRSRHVATAGKYGVSIEP
jgi:hypothetical protein